MAVRILARTETLVVDRLELLEPDELPVELATALEIGDGQPDLDAREPLGRRAGNDHDLDVLAVRILDERRAAALAAIVFELGRR